MDKLLKYTPWAILAVVILASLHTCNRQSKEISDSKKRLGYAYTMINDNGNSYKRDTTALGEELLIQKALYLNEKEAKELGLIENERLKKIKQEVKIVTRTVIQIDTIALTDTFTVVDGDTIRSKQFSVSDTWYGLSGKVFLNKLKIDSLYTKDEYVITTGFDKQGFLKKDLLTVDVVNKNPYSRVDELYNVTVPQPKKKWYQTKGAAIGAGVVGGLYLSTKL
jgi:hypothetical protein